MSNGFAAAATEVVGGVTRLACCVVARAVSSDAVSASVHCVGGGHQGHSGTVTVLDPASYLSGYKMYINRYLIQSQTETTHAASTMWHSLHSWLL